MSTSKEILSIFLQLIIAGLAIIFTAFLLPGIVVNDYLTGIIIAALLALLNITIKPILIFLTIPITLVTLGLFLLVINALLVMMAAHIVSGFTVDNFWWALLFSIILSLVNSIFGVSLGDGFRRK
jgi:putative membrane protein